MEISGEVCTELYYMTDLNLESKLYAHLVPLQ